MACKGNDSPEVFCPQFHPANTILGEGSQAVSSENKMRCKGWVSPARCALHGLCHEKPTGIEGSPL